MRIGFGYDIHKFVGSGRKLILGGVTIPYYKGLTGNSDADVLVHAICDAILGAIAARDIGTHFPPDDPTYTDISSLILLEKVLNKLKEMGYSIVNVDSTIICEKPRLAEFIPQMIENIAKVLNLQNSEVSVKATTGEGLDSIGKGEGVAAHAVVLVKSEKSSV